MFSKLYRLNIKGIFHPVFIIFTLMLICISLPLQAQNDADCMIQPQTFDRELQMDRGASGLAQTLKKLQTRASMLMITVHPDDEDGGFLAYQARGKGTRTSLLSLTRGEGGANVMSNDFFDALGLVRTEELIAACRYYGVDPYFGSVTDYGFSKTREEAFNSWGKDRVLADAVRVIRMTRPLVLSAVFIGGITDGHGHHQANGQIMQEAFKLAGDPNAYPEQIESGLRPWSPLKAYGRVPSALQEGSVNEKGIFHYFTQKWIPAGYQNHIENKWNPGALPATVVIPKGTYDPALGQNYNQAAREGLGMQKCQMGGSSIPPAGASDTGYHRFGSRVDAPDKEESIFDGIDISIQGIAGLVPGPTPSFLESGLAKIDSLVDRATENFSMMHPDTIAPVLAQGLQATRTLLKEVAASDLPEEAKFDVSFELRAKEAQFNTALKQALGISLLATVAPERQNSRGFSRGLPATFQAAVPDQKFGVSVRLTNQSPANVSVRSISLLAAEDENWIIASESAAAGPLEENKTMNAQFDVEVPADPTFTRPYFSRPGIHQDYYDIDVKKYVNQSHRPYPLTAWAEMDLDGVSFRIGQAVQAVKRITGLGTVLNPLVVVPAISVSLSPHAGVTRLDSDQFTVSVKVQSNVKGPAEGQVRLKMPEGWKSEPEKIPFSTVRDGEQQSVSFQVFPANISEKTYTVTAVADYQGNEYTEGFQTAGYPGLRPYNLYREASYRSNGVDVKVAPGLRVGYIMGSGDSVPDSMVSLGLQAAFLSEIDLASADLSQFDVIVHGVRTYAARPELSTHNGRLLDYVKNGGVVVVQYNTPEFDNNFGPYPYEMSRNPEEVTDQNSPINILNPEHPVLNWPNKITAKDFDGWIEQRGSKFLKTWDERYEALLETHDQGQPPQEGGFVYTTYGKGIYVYCAYAFYRQLPEGVPGAFRLFANLVSLPKNPMARGIDE